VSDVLSLRALLSLVAVSALLVGALWALRRGALSLPSMQARTTIVVETATSLGDRRSLAIVRVEGRRLLIGLTPSAVSLLSDLQSVRGDQVEGARGTT
jgi:flagellar biogenesis protein FliO